MTKLKESFPDEHIISEMCFAATSPLIPHTRVFHSSDPIDRTSIAYAQECKFYDQMFTWN